MKALNRNAKNEKYRKVFKKQQITTREYMGYMPVSSDIWAPTYYMYMLSRNICIQKKKRRKNREISKNFIPDIFACIKIDFGLRSIVAMCVRNCCFS